MWRGVDVEKVGRARATTPPPPPSSAPPSPSPPFCHPQIFYEYTNTDGVMKEANNFPSALRLEK